MNQSILESGESRIFFQKSHPLLHSEKLKVRSHSISVEETEAKNLMLKARVYFQGQKLKLHHMNFQFWVRHPFVTNDLINEILAKSKKRVGYVIREN